ncbi:MAG: ABC transporter permease, partial [Acidobacteriota bacterium]
MSDRKSLAKPPRLAAWILERLFADREMHSTLGDMEEIFHAEVEAGGRRRARFWYWHQLLKALPHRLLAVFLLDIPMFVLSLKIMFRSMARHKLFMALTLLALTLGLTCFFLIFLYSRYESTYDSFHPDSGRIYRLILDDRPGGQRDGTPGPSSGALESSIPEVEATAQTCRGFDPIIKIGKEKFQATGLFVGEEFLRLFRFPLRRGSGRSLSEPGRVVLTEQAARRLFGREDPLGRTLDFRIRDEGCLLTVSGIVADPPANTHFQFELLISYPTARSLAGYRNLLDRSNNRFPRTYVKLRRLASARAAAENIAAFLGSGAAPGSRLRATLQPLADVHLRPDGKNADAVHSLTLLIFLSVLILVVAVINYVNLATSRSSLRRREIGIRKTVGAQRRQLIRQFLGEAVVLTAVSFALAVGALLALLPAFNRTMERNLRLEQLFRGTSGLEIVGILLLVGVVAGIYPALCLSSFQPARILKGAEARAAGSSRPRNLLLVVQFTAAVVLVVLTLFIRGQIRFIRDRDPGFDKSRIVEAWAFPPDGILAKR